MKLKPDLNKEYIYRHFQKWKKSDSFICEKNFIVINVRLVDYSYHFIEKETGEEYYTSYAWSFAENTEENWKLIKMIDELEVMLIGYKRYNKELHSKLITLDSEIDEVRENKINQILG